MQQKGIVHLSSRVCVGELVVVQGLKIGVVVNDVAKVNIDAKLIHTDTRGQVREKRDLLFCGMLINCVEIGRARAIWDCRVAEWLCLL